MKRMKLLRCITAGLLAAVLILSVGCTPGTPPTEDPADTLQDTIGATEVDSSEKAPVPGLSDCLYVSPDGTAEGDGTVEKPFGSLHTALDRLRSETEAKPREIVLLDGDYYMSEPLRLTEADTAWYTTLHIHAQNSGGVRLIGGVAVDPALCKPVTDASILDRLVDKEAAGKLMMLDLRAVVGEVPALGKYAPMEVYVDGQALTMSRWPNNIRNEAYLRAESVVSVAQTPKDAPMTFTYADETNRAASWSEESLRDLYILSHLGVDWLNDWLKVTVLDPATRTVTTENGGTYGATAGNRFFFFNLLEEIDVPGESYVDREAGVVYFYPYTDTAQEIFVSTMTAPMLEIKGCGNITLEGVDFVYTRVRAILATETEALTIRDCDICHTSEMAMSLSGTRITVDGCEIADTWAGGISMSGGDRTTLASSQNVIQNCVIHDVNRSYETYKPGIWAESVGMEIRNNTFYNATHTMIKVFTNNAVIAHNEFYNCLTDSSDMGVIYFGQDPTLLGHEIVGNYFHDNGNTYGGIGQFAIYIDDGGAGAHIHHNIFYKPVPNDSAIRLHGAQYSLIEYNLFGDADSAVFNAFWPGDSPDGVKQYEWLLWLCDLAPNRQHDIQARIKESGMDSELWSEFYKDTIWAPLVDLVRNDVDQSIIAAYSKGQGGKVNKLLLQYAPYLSNALSNNIFLNIALYDSYSESEKPFYGDGILRGGGTKCENNVKVEEEDFVAYATDFALTEDGLAKVNQIIPGFENFSMDKVGPQKD